MSLLEGLQQDVFRRPISEDAPAGVNLRVNEAGREAWRALRDLREEARRIERQSESDPSINRTSSISHWQTLAEKAIETLSGKSRDVNVAAYLIEALVRTDGFHGLAAGCDVARAMVETHWDELFPLPDLEDGVVDEQLIAEEKAFALIQLVGDDSQGLLIPAILNIPLVCGSDGESYGLGHWRVSETLKRYADDDEELKNAVERGGVAPFQFRHALESTEPEFIQNVHRGICMAIGAWKQLSDAIAERSGGRIFLQTLPLESVVEECDAALRTFASDILAESEQVPSQSGNEVAMSGGQTPQGAPLVGGLVPQGLSRNNVLRSLETAADFFSSQDPHSLLAVQIRNVVRMARLPVKQYYQELILDDAGLKNLGRIAGISFTDDDEESA